MSKLRPVIILVALVFLSCLAHGQVCNTGMPTTINSNWTLQACNAISAGGGEGDCAVAGLTTGKCRYKVLQFFNTATAINLHDTMTAMCDADYDFASGTRFSSANMVDTNLSGISGTVNTVNSGGNSTITWVSGPTFTSSWVGAGFMIAGVKGTVTAFTDSTHITVNTNFGTLSAAPYGAGNGFTQLPQTPFDFSNAGNHVGGNEFYVADVQYPIAGTSEFIFCEVLTTGGNGVSDMDLGISLFRETGGGGSAGLDASSVWTNGTSAAGPCNQGPNSDGCLESTTPSITRSVTNDLVIAIQQQNGPPQKGSFSAGSAIGCDNDGVNVTWSGFWYYSFCSSSTATGGITATTYDGAATNYANEIFALKPTAPATTTNHQRGFIL